MKHVPSIRSTLAEYESSKRAFTSPGDSEGVYVAARRNRWRLWLMLVVVVAIGYGMFRLGWFDVAEVAVEWTEARPR